MTKPRIPETDHGITGEVTVAQYDEMLRTLRNRGWIETNAILAEGIRAGCALEVGPGPGYLGLEWLAHTQGTTLVGLDISAEMRALAGRNAAEYGLTGRARYELGSGDRLPFEDARFDAVFSNGSLHEWSDPKTTFGEIWRVLKPEGQFFISDLRRDMSYLLRSLMWWTTRPVEIRPGLLTSIDAAYTPEELRALAGATPLRIGRVSANALGLTLAGRKS